MGFSRQECCGRLSFPSPGDLSNPGIEPRSPTLQADALCLSHQGNPRMDIGTVKKELSRVVPRFGVCATDEMMVLFI